MLIKRNIQPWVAVFFGLTLLLAILPRPVLHEWVSGHQHPVSTSTDQVAKIEKSGPILTCDCMQVEFAPVFLAEISTFESPQTTRFSSVSVDIPSEVPTLSLYSRVLRGPPSIA